MKKPPDLAASISRCPAAVFRSRLVPSRPAPRTSASAFSASASGRPDADSRRSKPKPRLGSNPIPAPHCSTRDLVSSSAFANDTPIFPSRASHGDGGVRGCAANPPDTIPHSCCVSVPDSNPPSTKKRKSALVAAFRCCGPCNADGPHSQPVRVIRRSADRYPCTGTRVISTRRFCARPASVSLLATGRVSPAPLTIMRLLATPRPPR